MKLLLLALAAMPAWAAEKITIYSQYDYAPFWQNGRGLTPDLAQKLTQYSNGRYLFDVQIMPRKRLDAILENASWQGVVPWVTPAWFQDEAKTRYRWSSSLLNDADLVISNQVIKYGDASNLYGLRLGAILGHRYPEIEAAIQAGKIIRDDAPNQESNLKKLQVRRVDVIFVPYSSWGELLKNTPNDIRGMVVAAQPRAVYQRQLLISPNNPALAKYLQAAVVILNHDPVWLQKLQPFSYQGFALDR